MVGMVGMEEGIHWKERSTLKRRRALDDLDQDQDQDQDLLTGNGKGSTGGGG